MKHVKSVKTYPKIYVNSNYYFVAVTMKLRFRRATHYLGKMEDGTRHDTEGDGGYRIE